MQSVDIDGVGLTALASVIGEERFGALTSVAAEAAEVFSGRALYNVNSTARGGGVAEMLRGLLGYVHDVGIDVRWSVIDANPEFFMVTKRIHNRIHGFAGDTGELGPVARHVYEEALEQERDALLARIRPGDVVLLHDPQTLGLGEAVRRAGAHVVWRCHIGADRPNAFTEEAWSFLAPYLDSVDHVVVSRTVFAPPDTPTGSVHVIPPSFDPLAAKNLPLADDERHRILAYAGLLQGSTEKPAVFRDGRGHPRRVDRRADIIQLGPPPPADSPLVVQISRWDRLKDMAGVMSGFAEHVGGPHDAHLVLAGPVVTGVADDPEGALVFDECVDAWKGLAHVDRQHVHLACLPTADVDENAILVNALQRQAAIVTQKSLAEGFGLTVVEAMWKGAPVVASAVGGIADQIVDGESGALIDDPADLAAFGRALVHLLDHPEQAAKLGQAAADRSRDFLPDVHLTRWAHLLGEVLGGESR